LWQRAALLLGLALGMPLVAQPVGNRELQIEAAFLVNFVRYTDWPPQHFNGPGDPYVIAVVGSETSFDTVAAIAGAAGAIQGRRIEVVRVEYDGQGGIERRRAAIQRMRASHLLFLQASADAGARDVVRAVAGAPVLTVSDVPGFASKGGMIGLVRSGQHLAFEANPAAIHASGVVLSAKVLKLARIREDAS
jgi:hypothetical protein